jgi:hypothetical protein
MDNAVAPINAVNLVNPVNTATGADTRVRPLQNP